MASLLPNDNNGNNTCPRESSNNSSSESNKRRANATINSISDEDLLNEVKLRGIDFQGGKKRKQKLTVEEMRTFIKDYQRNHHCMLSDGKRVDHQLFDFGDEDNFWNWQSECIDALSDETLNDFMGFVNLMSLTFFFNKIL